MGSYWFRLEKVGIMGKPRKYVTLVKLHAKRTNTVTFSRGSKVSDKLPVNAPAKAPVRELIEA